VFKKGKKEGFSNIRAAVSVSGTRAETAGTTTPRTMVSVYINKALLLARNQTIHSLFHRYL